MQSTHSRSELLSCAGAVLLSLLLPAYAQCSSPEIAESTTIAKMEGREILYRDIRCNDHLLDQGAERGKGKCLEYEQAKLDSLLTRKLILFAARHYDLVLSAEDREMIERRLKAQRSAHRDAAERIGRLALAVRDVRRGTPREQALRDHQGEVNSQEFDYMMSQLRDDEAVTRMLERDRFAEFQKAARTNEEISILAEKIRQAIESGVIRRESTHDEGDFWSHVVSASQLQVEDERYRMPNLIGVLSK